MINHIRFVWQLLVLASIILIAGILAISQSSLDLPLTGFIITLVSFTVINLIAWFLMNWGIRKSSKEGVVILLAGIGLKFLLYLLYILVFWLLTKILTKAFIITFFALYLVFTFLLAGHLFKLLKNN